MVKRYAISLFLALSVFALCVPARGGQAAKEWTFMVFMNGNNDLESYCAKDIAELEKTGSGAGLDIVVQAARIGKPVRRYHVVKNDGSAKTDDWGVASELREKIERVDMGDHRELVRFVKWCVDNYPARRYALFIWNHGDGWKAAPKNAAVRGISYDDVSKNHMTTKDLGLACDSIRGVIGHNIDILGMDACLMQMIEIAANAASGPAMANATGLSVYFPKYNFRNKYLDLKIAAHRWDEMIISIFAPPMVDY